MTPYQVGTNALSATALRPPFAYFGGKQKIAVDIAELLAGHSGGDSLIRDQCDGLIRDPPGLRRGVVTA